MGISRGVGGESIHGEGVVAGVRGGIVVGAGSGGGGGGQVGADAAKVKKLVAAKQGALQRELALQVIRPWAWGRSQGQPQPFNRNQTLNPGVCTLYSAQ